jgi:prevent-host-death family protein
MRSASVRALKNKTSELLRRASREDVVITSRGRPIACLVGVDDEGRPLLARRREAPLSAEEKRRMLRLAARIWKIKPDKRKNWIPQEHHDQALYGENRE